MSKAKTTKAAWAKEGDSLTKTYVFKDFPEAISFMAEVAFFCQEKNHHPEWTNVYNHVEVRLTTHDAGGVTAKDRALAKKMDDVYTRFVR